AQLAHAEGRHVEARALAARAVDVIKDARQRAAALRIQAASSVAAGDLGDAAFWRGDKASAASLYSEAGRAFTNQRGRHHDVAMNLWNLGYVEMERGALADAKKLFLAMRKECRAARDRLGEANAENALGELLRKLG